MGVARGRCVGRRCWLTSGAVILVLASLLVILGIVALGGKDGKVKNRSRAVEDWAGAVVFGTLLLDSNSSSDTEAFETEKRAHRRVAAALVSALPNVTPEMLRIGR